MRTDLVVIRRRNTDDERFSVLDVDADWFAGPGWNSLGDLLARVNGVFVDRVKTAEVLDEPALRARLSERGLSADEIDWQIRRARNMTRLESVPLTCERITRVGYRNEYGQTVVSRTDLAGGAPGQRLFVLKCGVCGCEHSADGSEIHRRRCPQCRAA